ncbi:nucleotidyltransferase domain-containing protein [Acidithrix ferrooxidans]|uniref:cGAS/DncV-like nucleotidyltransferase C-terminal helical domain-containing protein n=1 Tax=Acidithrix ferrooxidans TaxID=1280514 RepID=A0A0D8HHR6_9ACTN|nr:nucleotidyltransferase [Acidithrix ferrooxidans]KJF16621.1 hypothetical protein AXFE_24830 [Acidithrix ferrooxidans]
MTALEDKLSGWTGPSSDTEQEKQDRTERMIREAVRNHAEFANCSLKVYAKGSYANNTNVRSDSDVDIAVQCTNALYWNEVTPGVKPVGTPYTGPWTPARLRSELKTALEAKFPGQVDSSGSTAFTIKSGSARVDADVVPCFDHRYYFSPDNFLEGTKVFKTDNSSLLNYPDQQKANGNLKNQRTNQRYKKAVRIMKRLENAMVTAGVHREVPSFFVECLVYNIPDAVLNLSTWTELVRGTLGHIYNQLEGSESIAVDGRWREVNECKYLFDASQKWTRSDGRDFALAGWNYLGYKS